MGKTQIPGDNGDSRQGVDEALDARTETERVSAFAGMENSPDERVRPRHYYRARRR